MPKKVYISGPISNDENYKEKFNNAAKTLLVAGYKVLNPANINDVMPVATYEEYMKIDMFLLDMCDSIYMLEGWEKSPGANREYGYALAKNKYVIFE
jgi:nucleoside 2-deoxyribosyltransferase